MEVKQQRHVSAESEAALLPALKYSNMTVADVQQILRGFGWMLWDIGGVGYVLTMINKESEIEVLLAGGKRAKECALHWEAAMVAHPAHKGMTMRVDGRKGWARLLPHWERRDGVLIRKIPDGQEEV